MLAMLDDDAKFFCECDRLSLRDEADAPTQRVFERVLVTKEPRITLRAATDQHSVHLGLSHAAIDIPQVLQVTVAKNQRVRSLGNLHSSADRLLVRLAFFALYQCLAMHGDSFRPLVQNLL